MKRPRLPFPGRPSEPADAAQNGPAVAAALPWHIEAPAGTTPPRARAFAWLGRLGLSGRLFLLTVAFVV
ncbi:hypothetical protein, partial [Vibrio alginolyticus]|uniref:hypothetical protein n=1 Tax=Vibrio alginolyticus TaxID=663 RepID=UPI001A8E128A